MNLALFTERALTRAWQLAAGFVQACTYVLPVGFNAATGLTRTSESTVSVQALIVTLQPREWDLVITQPDDERVIIRAKELGGVVPLRGDYLVSLDGTRRDVNAVRKVAGGLLWVLYCTPNLFEDWGDLVTATATEDYGDFTAPNTREDWGTLL